MADQPSWMADSAARPTGAVPTTASAAPANSGDDKIGGCMRSFFHLINVGLCILMAYAAVLSIKDVSNGDITAFFLGGYLFAFAFLLFCYEVVRFMPDSKGSEIMRRNFGWFYGNKGRGIYLIFVGFMALGLTGRASDAAGYSCLVWGGVTVGMFFARPEWFLPEKGL